MNVPEFDGSLRTGYAVIDDQHAWLFELAARVSRIGGDFALDDAPSGGGDESCQPRVEDAAAEALHGLIDSAAEHFADEEATMRDARYPLASVHAGLHADLLRRLAGLVFRYVNGNGSSAEEIVIFFIDWLTECTLVIRRSYFANAATPVVRLTSTVLVGAFPWALGSKETIHSIVLDSEVALALGT
jgi:hemerythrin-like metal-binding protein